MDRNEASALLDKALARYREYSYAELRNMVGSNSAVEVRGSSRAEYQIEVDVMWDSPRDKTNIRVMASIDDGRFLAALNPLCDSFIMTPDGKFLGE